jgi:hypothetical protein
MLIKEDLMKTLLSALSILVLAVACNKEPAAEFQEKQQEANKEYRDQVNDANEERIKDVQNAREARDKEIKDAREDLSEQQKEEAVEYVEDSEAATVNPNSNTIKIIKKEKQE